MCEEKKHREINMSTTEKFIQPAIPRFDGHYDYWEPYFAKENFKRCSSEHTLFTKKNEGNILIVSLHVDDLIFTRNNRSMCEKFKSSMMLEFDMSDLGRMRHFLGIEVIQSDAGISICQRRYAREVLARFNMADNNPVRNPIVREDYDQNELFEALPPLPQENLTSKNDHKELNRAFCEQDSC
uniref:Retrovirus-related Pol polyprotein from transposon TNT 1-94 n=1 Tax=Cajanus cajan TaxID=3821 RepID=A0A151RDF3_CAJCA|nr:Retrovirus-related Pol polyprotein from transposon TNT 1-94 [Cajanus cajan]